MSTAFRPRREYAGGAETLRKPTHKSKNPPIVLFTQGLTPVILIVSVDQSLFAERPPPQIDAARNFPYGSVSCGSRAKPASRVGGRQHFHEHSVTGGSAGS